MTTSQGNDKGEPTPFRLPLRAYVNRDIDEPGNYGIADADENLIASCDFRKYADAIVAACNQRSTPPAREAISGVTEEQCGALSPNSYGLFDEQSQCRLFAKHAGSHSDGCARWPQAPVTDSREAMLVKALKIARRYVVAASPAAFTSELQIIDTALASCEEKPEPEDVSELCEHEEDPATCGECNGPFGVGA
jgi:hypothetical protein